MTGQRDLFGNKVGARRPRYEASLERADRRALRERAARIRWLNRLLPARSGYLGMPLETFHIFDEAKFCFVYGSFAATVVLAAAFVEHWLAGRLAGLGYERAANTGLAATVEYCRVHDVLPDVLTSRIDRLRQIRNPFVHLKSFDHAHSLGRRAMRLAKHPHDLLEMDAKESLVTIYSVITYAFPNR